MKQVFDKFKEMNVIHSGYTGIVCGYTDTHIILAVETKNEDKRFFGIRNFQNPFILEEYKNPRYKFILEDERELEKQYANQKN